MSNRLSTEELDLFRAWIGAHVTLSQALDADLQAAAGLSLGEYQVMLALSEEGNLRMHELANRASLSKSALTRRVDQMVNSEWLERQKCPSDKRGFTIAMTQKGRGVFRRAAPHHLLSIRSRFLDQLSESDRKKLLSVLHSLNNDHVCPKSA